MTYADDKFRELCAIVIAEKDPNKMVQLMEQLNQLLSIQEQRLSRERESDARIAS